jgi:hypothetical protein
MFFKSWQFISGSCIIERLDWNENLFQLLWSNVDIEFSNLAFYITLFNWFYLVNPIPDIPDVWILFVSFGTFI